jgi:hypothetical protein
VAVVLVAKGGDQLGVGEMLNDDLKGGNLTTAQSLVSASKNSLVLLGSERMSILGIGITTIVVGVDRILGGGVLGLLLSNKVGILLGESKGNISKLGARNCGSKRKSRRPSDQIDKKATKSCVGSRFSPNGKIQPRTMSDLVNIGSNGQLALSNLQKSNADAKES